MKINSIMTMACALTVSGAMLTGCAEERQSLSGEGRLQLSAGISGDTQVNSRAISVDEYEQLGSQAIVWISNSKGPVRKYKGLENIPADGVKLLSDHYIAEVWTGDSVSASWDKKWYKGYEEFDIYADETTRLVITASIANTVASVVYDESVKGLISNFKMTVGHKRGELVFEGENTDKGYFMMPSKDKNLQWNLEGTLANGTVYTRNGVIENAKPATEYIIRVTSSENGSEEGGGYFDVVIDERAIEIEDIVYIKLAPQIEGYDFDIDQPAYLEKGRAERKSIWIYGSSPLTELEMRSSLFTDIIGGEDVNLLAAGETVISALREKGIDFLGQTWDQDGEYSSAKINFDPSFLNSLEDGNYEIAFSAKDENGKSSNKTWSFNISDAPVMTEAVFGYDVWATHTTLTGKVLKSDAANPGIRYRAKGTQAWTDANASSDGTTLTAELTDLTPGTVYEYQSYADDYDNADIREFTTESAPQFPNAGFEEWNTSGKAYLICTDEGSMFWDSGNHGSATMSKNVTAPAEDKKHSGNYSIKLNSQFVGIGTIGKFAAGNVFIGKYLETLGTNGVLGWGRPWSSRPKAVKGYLHYTPQAITDVAKNFNKVSKGDMDTGIIYIAILDETLTSYNGKKVNAEWPVIVNTETVELFSKDDPNVIGYGEIILTEATQGDAMVEFTIPIEYFRTDIKASNIMLTASASRWGDYFTGGPSILYLDDLELVY